MADDDSTVRQRKAKAAPEKEASPEKPAKKQAAEEDDYTPWLDILRVLSFVFVASCGLSYLISSGETWFWGMKNPPNYLQASWWKRQWVSYAHHTPLYLTTPPLPPFLT